MIVSLIPTSTSVCYAALAGLGQGELVAADCLRPSPGNPFHDHPESLHSHLQQPSLRAVMRVIGLMRDTADLLDELQPAQVVVRVPSAMFGQSKQTDGRGSLAIHGLAAGVILAAVEHTLPGRVVPITDRDWAAARGSKKQLQQTIDATYPTYDWADDPHGHVADAIGLARWWINEKRLLG